MRRATHRDWAYYVQVFGLIGFWAFAFTVAGWFLWRGLELHRHGDVWVPAVVLGSVLGTIFFVFAGTFTYLFLKLGATRHDVKRIRIAEVERALPRFVLEPLSGTVKAAILFLGAIVAWGLYAWYYQVSNGLHVTGLNRPVFWGFYIINFVFFIGISHAGTLVSAILRISRAEWRRPITRAAEAITVMVLGFGAWNIFLDMGRIDHMHKVFDRGRLGSPLMWDVCSITTYLIASTLYLYLPLIPDLARLRDKIRGWRKPIYHLLSFGWRDTEGQKHALERCIAIMAVIVLPVAVSVHTVVSWVFSMTVQPMWHSTIFGPYFVVGAIFSGIAALLIAMALIRRHLKLQEFIKEVHFNYLGTLLLVMSLLWLYFTLSEYLTVFYGDEPAEMAVFLSKFGGKYAPYFWVMVVSCFVIPVTVLSKWRGVRGTVIASVFVCLGMWLERFTIVVPTLESTRLAYPAGAYAPSWVEISLMAAAFAGFALLYLLFARFVPIVSIWEVEEGRLLAAKETAERVQGYFPTDRAAEKAAVEIAAAKKAAAKEAA